MPKSNNMENNALGVLQASRSMHFPYEKGEAEIEYSIWKSLIDHGYLLKTAHSLKSTSLRIKTVITKYL